MAKFTKNGVALLVGTMALVALAGLAQAETRFAVQDAAGTTDKMVVTDTGYIGVGTSTPTSGIQTKGSTIQASQIVSHFIGTDPNSSGGYLAYRNNLSGATPILPKKNDRIGYMLFGGLAADNTARNAAGLVGYADADWANTSIPAYFLFELASPTSGTGRLERMRISSTGNVGVGTPTPTQKIEVNGGIRFNPAVTNSTPVLPVKPAVCDSTVRGTLWFTMVSTGDLLEICMKIDAAGNYNWVRIN
jgi:hypothetical protein